MDMLESNTESSRSNCYTQNWNRATWPSFRLLVRIVVMLPCLTTAFLGRSSTFSESTIAPLNAFPISATTGDTPQSKIWSHDGHWWSVMPNSAGAWLWQLEGNTWQSKLLLSSGTKFRADVVSDGDIAHVLLFDGANSRLASLEYDQGSQEYSFWSQRPAPTSIPLAASAETATLALDTVGRLWLASDRKVNVGSTSFSQFEVRYSEGNYAAFSSAQMLGWSGSSDDIIAITSLPGGSVLTMWSNQVSKQFRIRERLDTAAPISWSAETAASVSTPSIGGGLADDHLNFAVASDGTLYVAVKTSFDTSGYAKIALLVRHPSGQWDPLHYVDDVGTRPIVLLDESIERLMVVYTAADGGGEIVFRETALDRISFSEKHTVLAGTLNDATSAKGGGNGQFVIMASGGGFAHSSLLSYAPALSGDFDSDGDVDGADYAIWQAHFSMASGAELDEGDADGDGDVDGADFVAWQTSFSAQRGASGAAVAEPIASIHFVFGIVALTVARGRLTFAAART